MSGLRRVLNAPLLMNDEGEVVGIQDFNDGEEHLFVFDGEPANSLAFNTNPDTSRALGVGELRWNDTDGTLEFVLKGGNVTLQIGQEQVVRLKNPTGSTLTNGTVVYFTGSDGVNKTVNKAQANAEATSAMTIAVLTEDIQNGGHGFGTTNGLVRAIDTSTLTEGAVVYLSAVTAGGLTSTKPTAPSHMVQIGFCVRQHAVNGVLFVKIENGYELDELHNVLISNPQNGDVLKYNASAGIWYNAQP